MADKPISSLTSASEIKNHDLLILEQDSIAKKITGQMFIAQLLGLVEAHGGISDITWSESGTTGDGKRHIGVIHYADGSTSSFAINDGVKGNPGADSHVWLKYASDLPVRDSDMHDTPDNYIGIYSGTAATAPTDYSLYKWYQWKGDKGDTGTAAKLLNPTVTYVVSDSGKQIPSDGWQPIVGNDLPTVPGGSYLWTRTRLPWNDGSTTIAYSVSRFGIDGSGAVSTVNSVGPDGNGNVVVAPNNIIIPSDNRSLEAHLTALESSVASQEGYKPIHFTMTLSSSNREVDDERITADMRLFNPSFGTPSAIRSELTYTTTATNIVFTGTIEGTTTFEFDLMKVDS